jgi:hypothetical protein
LEVGFRFGGGNYAIMRGGGISVCPSEEEDWEILLQHFWEEGSGMLNFIPTSQDMVLFFEVETVFH